jgi:hypothetical protein
VRFLACDIPDAITKIDSAGGQWHQVAQVWRGDRNHTFHLDGRGRAFHLDGRGRAVTQDEMEGWSVHRDWALCTNSTNQYPECERFPRALEYWNYRNTIVRKVEFPGNESNESFTRVERCDRILHLGRSAFGGPRAMPLHPHKTS